MKPKRGNRKVLNGTVISNKMAKTVVVQVKDYKKHPLYGKIIMHRMKAYAHDEEGKCQMGDEVMIMETRPLSKLKRWRVVKIIKKGEQT
jgi:small subunit ribosomal protein S17